MSYNLNPGASEFVPTFTVPDMSSLNLNENSSTAPHYPQHQQRNNNNNNNNNNYHNNYNQQANQGGFYDQNYYHHQPHHQNSNYRGNNYNPNYRGNNYNPNYRGGHHHNNNNNNNSHQFYGQGSQNNGYHYQQPQTYDVDPVELEARCEAVIEILQDDKIRDSLNPNHDPNFVETTAGQNDNCNDGDEQQCDDEEEMLEMMAMQEECRLEMMKFYIQSQNPTLFEEIYHDVSYPDAAKKFPEEELRSPKVMTQTQQQQQQNEVQQQQQQQQQLQQEDETKNVNNSLKDLIINELNPDVEEFVPNKFATENAESSS